MKKVYITGVSGTGKSTIAKEFEKRGIFTISIDEVEGLCCWRNKKTGVRVEYHFDGGKDWFENYDWMCDSEKLKELINVEKDLVVVAGIAGNQNSYLSLFDKVFVLQCKPEIFIKRVIERDTNDAFGKTPSEQEFLLNLYQNFEKDLLTKGAISINTENPIETVTEEVISIISK